MIDYLALNQDAYRRMDWAHYNLRPKPTEFVVVYEDEGDKVMVISPADHFVAMLMHGNLARNMRDIAPPGEAPMFDGGGELLPPMTEQEAIEFVAWKDVPISVQIAHAKGNRPRIVICHKSQLPERTFRNAWRLDENDHIDADGRNRRIAA